MGEIILKREERRGRKERREDLASCFVSWWLTVWVRGVGLYSSLSRSLDKASCIAAFLTSSKVKSSSYSPHKYKIAPL